MTKENLTVGDLRKVENSVLWTFFNVKKYRPYLSDLFAHTIAAMINEDQNPNHSYNRAAQILSEGDDKITHPQTVKRRMELIARAYGGDLAELRRERSD